MPEVFLSRGQNLRLFRAHWISRIITTNFVISAFDQTQVARHHAVVTIHFSLITNADVYLIREHTVLYMPFSQPCTAAIFSAKFRLRLSKLLAEVLRSIVGM